MPDSYPKQNGSFPCRKPCARPPGLPYGGVMMPFLKNWPHRTPGMRTIIQVFILTVFILVLHGQGICGVRMLASPQVGTAPLTVQFTDLSTVSGTVTSKMWNFGDGTTEGVSGTTVTHTYQSPGVYTATLTYISGYPPHSSSWSDSKTIQVTTPPESPVLTSPEDGTTGVSRAPSLATDPFSDPDAADRHQTTQWQVSTASDFSSLTMDITTAGHLTALTVPRLVLLENTTYYWRVRFFDSNGIPSEWSDVFSFTTETTQNDLNGNGIPDTLENNTVDLDNDGQADIGQTHIKSLNTAVGNGQMGVSVQGSSTVTGNPEIGAVDPASISPVSLPHSMPLGLFGMRLNVAAPGDTASVVVYFSQAASQDASWYMYDSNNGWTDYSDYAAFSPDRRSATVTLTDGGHGDADGTANGIIVDPSGFGVASWIRGAVTDSVTDEAITTASVDIDEVDITFSSVLDGNYLGMILPGTYDLTVSADGYETEEISGVVVTEAGIVTTDVSLVPEVKITGLDISGNQGVFSDVEFSVSAVSEASTLYYRFSVHPDYGTDGYDGRHWSSMTKTEWVTTSKIDYQFQSNGKYIVVVWVTADTENYDSNGIAILGTFVEIGGSCRTEFSGFSVSETQKAGTPVTITVNGQNVCSGDLYYRFSVHPFYGTSGYDGKQWTLMTATEWWYSNSINYTFTDKGKYIVVIWGARSLSSTDPTGIPILGWSVDID